jgi:hypothetical protein
MSGAVLTSAPAGGCASPGPTAGGAGGMMAGIGEPGGTGGLCAAAVTATASATTAPATPLRQTTRCARSAIRPLVPIRVDATHHVFLRAPGRSRNEYQQSHRTDGIGIRQQAQSH